LGGKFLKRKRVNPENGFPMLQVKMFIVAGLLMRNYDRCRYRIVFTFANPFVLWSPWLNIPGKILRGMIFNDKSEGISVNLNSHF